MEEKVLSNLDEEGKTSNLDGELREIMPEFMVGVKFEELVQIGSKFLFKFRQALEFLRHLSINESELVKSIIKSNKTKRVNGYIEVGCTNSFDSTNCVTQLNTSLSGLQNCLTEANNIVNELENLVTKAGDVLYMNSNYQSEDLLGSETSEKLDAIGCASFMALIYSMIKQDYKMQERIISSLNFKCSSGELKSYCIMWMLRPFINDDVIHQAMRQVR